MSHIIKPFNNSAKTSVEQIVFQICAIVKQLKMDPSEVQFEAIYTMCHILRKSNKLVAIALYRYLRSNLDNNTAQVNEMIDSIFLSVKNSLDSEKNNQTQADLPELWKVVCDYHRQQPGTQNIDILEMSVSIMCDNLISSENVDDYTTIYRLAYNLWLKDKVAAKHIYDKYIRISTTPQAKAKIEDAMMIVRRTC